MSSGRIVSTAAAVAVLLFFFLPWVTVSCSEEEIATLSGYDLAVGTDIDLGVGMEELDPDLLIFAIPAAALVVLVLIGAWWLGVIPPNLSTAGQVSAASMGLIVLAFKWLEAQRDTAEYDFVSYTIQIGVWVAVVGFVVIIAGAAWARAQYAASLDDSPTDAPP